MSTKKLEDRRASRVRYKIRQQRNNRVRLSVFRSNQHIYAQLIDDRQGITIASASTVELVSEKAAVSGVEKKKGKSVSSGSASASLGKPVEAAQRVGALIAERGKQKNVETVVFDRGGYLYHGRVKALAEAARVGGLKF